MFVKFVFDVIKGIRKDNVSAYSAQAAFFVTISFIPFIMLLMSILRFFPFTITDFTQQILEFFPQAARGFVASFITEAYQKSDAFLISVTAVSTLWVASIGVYSITKGLNQVYCADETRNYFALRFTSILYTILFLLFLVLCLLIFVFGNTITAALKTYIPQFFRPALIVLSFRKLVGMAVLSIFFIMLFTVVPNRKAKLLSQGPGAVISAAGWVIFSYVFSYYYENISGYSYLYGSLSVLVFFMLWLFFCIYIVFIGAEVNSCIEERIAISRLLK
ncbi:MAG: YihY/virulence factor BrkB family protein [Clostridia bacterium]|nr:YihY/virulence factor BrkB family protein [Clostridia bacterium]